MSEGAFVVRSEWEAHLSGHPKLAHGIWKYVRDYVPGYGYSKPAIDAMFAGTEGSIAFADASGFIAEDNANLFWDAANLRLGIGTPTPGCALDIEFPAVETVTSRISAQTRPWRHWECIDGDWGYAFGVDANDKMFHIHYDSPIGNEQHGMIHLDGDNVRVGILEDNPVYPFDVGGNTRIQGTFRVTGTTVLVGRATLESGVQGDLDVTGLLTATGGDFLVASGDALRVGTGANHLDVDFHLGYVTGGNWETYGFYWRYKGSGAGNDNTLQLWAQNQAGAHVKVYEIWQDGAITFSPDVTLGTLNITAELRFYANGNYVGFEAPALDADQIWVLPAADGDDGDALVTDGAGNLAWAAGGAGAATFVALTDTPANYAGAADKIVKVNAVPDGLEFGADIEDLEDVDTLTGQAGKYAKVKVGDAGVEWVVGVGAITEFLDLTDTPAVYTLKRGYVPVVNDAEDGLVFIHSKDLPPKKTIDDPPDDEFEAATLDGKWTVVDGASGTVDLIGIAGNIYDLASRRGHLLVQAINGDEFSIRQDYTLADGKSIILAVSPAISFNTEGGVTNNEIMVKLSLNDNDGAHEAGNYVTISIDTQADGMRILYYKDPNFYGTGGVNCPINFGQKFYLRILRNGTTYYGFYSFDCETWVPLYKQVVGVALTNIWITVDSSAAVATPVPIQAFDWIRLGDDKVCPW